MEQSKLPPDTFSVVDVSWVDGVACVVVDVVVVADGGFGAKDVVLGVTVDEGRDDVGRGLQVVTGTSVVPMDTDGVVEIWPKFMFGFSLAVGGNCQSGRLSGLDTTFGTV